MLGRGGGLTAPLEVMWPANRNTWTAWPRSFFDGIKDGLYHPSNADLRVKDLDIDGLDAEVIYGILGIRWRRLLRPGFKDPEVTATIYDVYNEWIAEFTSADPGRMKGLALPRQPRSPREAANSSEGQAN